MPRRRRNDPVGVSDTPIVVADPEREAQLTAEFRRRLQYLISSYRAEKGLGLDRKSFNQSLSKLKEAVREGHRSGAPKSRLNPWIETAINTRARELAGIAPEAPLKPEHDQFVQRAAADVAQRAKALRGTPGSVTVRWYVAALMALIQETTGKPVLAMRHKDNVYEPQLPGVAGEVIRGVVAMLEPRVGETKLVNWICEMRREHAGKPMRFHDYFPAYGAVLDEKTGLPVLVAPYRLEQLAVSSPISCP